MKVSPRIVFVAVVVCGLPSAVHVGWRLGGLSSPLGPSGVGLFGEAPATSAPPSAVATWGTAPPGTAPRDSPGATAGRSAATAPPGASRLPAPLPDRTGGPTPAAPTDGPATTSPPDTAPVPDTPTPSAQTSTPDEPDEPGPGDPENTLWPYPMPSDLWPDPADW